MFEHGKTIIICRACHSKSDRENKRNERKILPKNLILSVDDEIQPAKRISRIIYNFSTPSTILS